jgi:hypothetical protein
MISYEDLVEIARICLEQARKAERAAVKNELEHIARGYQMRAASMRHGVPSPMSQILDLPNRLAAARWPLRGNCGLGCSVSRRRTASKSARPDHYASGALA